MPDFPHREQAIGDHVYRAHALPMKQWTTLGEFLAEFLGEPIGALVRGFDVGDLRELLLGDSGAVAILFSSVAQKLTQKRLLAVTVHMGPSLQVMGDDGGWTPLDAQTQDSWWALYRGELPGAVKLFLTAQYADFFVGCGALMPIKSKSAASPSESTNAQGDGPPTT